MAGNHDDRDLNQPEVLAALPPEELESLGDAVHGAFAGDALTPEQRLRHLRRIRAAAGTQPRARGVTHASRSIAGEGREERMVAPPPVSAEPLERERPWWRGRVVRAAGMAASMAFVAIVTALLVVFLRPLSDEPVEREPDLGVVGEPTAADVPREFVPAGGEITFSAPQGDNTQMLLVNADGSFARPILTNDADFWLPSWSPDGERVAFASQESRTGAIHVYVMNADGSDLVQLTTREGGHAPIWSPDGQYIAYQAWVENRTGLYIVPVDRSAGPRNVSGSVSDPWHARWSPDSTRIAFESENAIYITEVVGERAVQPRKLVAGAAPEWSPDGKRIAYAAWESGDVDLFTIAVDGTDAVNLTDTEPLNESTPVWSPDGRWIAYSVAERDGDGTTWLNVVDAAGTNPRQVSTFVSRSPIYVAWSADSRQIAFTGQPGGPGTDGNTDWTLSIVNADGSDERELFKPVSKDTHPVWRPDWWSKGAIAGTPDTDEPVLTLSDQRGSCGALVQAVGKNLEPDTLVRIFSGAVAVSDPATVGRDGSFVTEIDLSALSACGTNAPPGTTSYTFSVVVDRGTSQSNTGIHQAAGELTGATATFTVVRD